MICRIHPCALVLCLACLVAGSPRSARADARLQSFDVFTSRTEGYNTFRIPSIVRTGDGSLIAVAEGRLSSGADPGGTHIDLVYKRSTDGGQTWSPLAILDRNPATVLNGSGVPTDKTSACNSVSVVDPTNNRVWVFDMRLPSGVGAMAASATVDDMQTWARHSDDNGQTWSTAQRISVPQYTDFYPNIGSGIQMTNGRLVVPSTARTFDGTVTKSFALTSTDHGVTWQAGSLISTPTNEQQIVQLADGSLFSSARQNGGGNRIHSLSTDQGSTWQSSNGIAMTQVAAGLERYSLAGVDGATQNRILFSLPEGGPYGARSNLNVMSSFDEAQTFGNSRRLYVGPAAYSDMQRLPGDEVGVFWERGGYQTLTYTIFNSQFLDPSTAKGLLASESFAYAGSSVGWANGGNGWTSTWSDSGSGSSALNSQCTAGLTASGLQHSGITYAQGGAASLQGQTMARGLGVPIDLSTPRTYYLSALLQRQSITSNNNQFLNILLEDSTGTSQASFGGGTGGNWFITAPGNTVNTAANSITNGTTYLLVAKLVAGETGFDQMFLKVIPDGQSIPATDSGLNWTLVGTTNENSSAVLDRLEIQGGSNATWLVDELRLGLDWHSVTGVPEPTSTGLLLLASAGLLRRRRRDKAIRS